MDPCQSVRSLAKALSSFSSLPNLNQLVYRKFIANLHDYLSLSNDLSPIDRKTLPFRSALNRLHLQQSLCFLFDPKFLFTWITLSFGSGY